MRKQTWPFPAPLVRGTLVKRYKRFLADVCLEGGQEITAHCPNTGSMKTCWNEGDEVWLSKSDNAKRKLPYTWELTKTQGGYIGVNTARPNQVVEWAIYQKLIPELCQWTELKREVAYGNEKSRIDIRLNLEKSEKVELLRWIENGYHIKACIINKESISVDTPQDLVNVIEKISLQNS